MKTTIWPDDLQNAPPQRRDAQQSDAGAPPGRVQSGREPGQRLKAEVLKMEREGGYQRISFEDFLLDGKILAARQAKVSIDGFYVKLGEIESFFPSTLAAIMAQKTLRTGAGIGLLTEDADRDLRRVLLYCRNNMALSQWGCRLTLLGHVMLCEKMTLVGTSSMPCLFVENGDGVAP